VSRRLAFQRCSNVSALTDPDQDLTSFIGTGTTNYPGYLSIQPALDFRQWLGGEQKINDYCRSLALSGGKLLSELLGTPLLDPTGEFTLNMINNTGGYLRLSFGTMANGG